MLGEAEQNFIVAPETSVPWGRPLNLDRAWRRTLLMLVAAWIGRYSWTFTDSLSADW
jgi:hypothetical protein